MRPIEIQTVALALSCALLCGCGQKAERGQERSKKVPAAPKASQFEPGKGEAPEELSKIKSVAKAVTRESQDAAVAIGQGVGGVISGVKEGIDKFGLAGEIRVEPGLAEAGVTATRIQRMKGDDGSLPPRGVCVYVIFDQAFDGALMLKVLDKQDREIGRSTVAVTQPKGSAQFTDFVFDERTPLHIAACYLLQKGEKPPPSSPASAPAAGPAPSQPAAH